MSIAQRKDGRYLVKYKVNGTWKQKAFRSLKEAEEFESDTKLDEAVTDTRMTVGELMTVYVRSTTHHKTTTFNLVSSLCGNKNKYTGKESCGQGKFLFDRYVDSLTRKDLLALREKYKADGWKNSSINTVVSSIKGMLSWAVEQELILANPWHGLRNLPNGRNEIKVSMDTYRAIYALAPAWLQWAMKTCFCLCLRWGKVELFGLKWSSFDFDYGIVRVKQGKSGIYKTVIPPKEYMVEASERYAADKERGIEYVCTRKGKPVNTYDRAWHIITRKIGVKMRPYDVRHLAATTMLANGADLPSVAAQLGHQNCAMTGRVYAHATTVGQRFAASTLAIA